MASTLLPASPTPIRVAEAYSDLILKPRAATAAGKDGRISAGEAAKDPFVADAYKRLGAQRPTVGSVVASGQEGMLASAKAVSGGDGRVSNSDAEHMSPVRAQAFAMLRSGDLTGAGDAAEVAAALQAAAKDLLFMSESDYPFTAFSLKVDPSLRFDEATLKAIFDFVTDETGKAIAYPNGFILEIQNGADTFARHDGDDPVEQRKWKALDKAFKAAVVKSAGAATVYGGAWNAPPAFKNTSLKIWVATPREQDASFAPYYIFGRLPNGDVVGLKTFRVWT